jgi:hypothetical protein
MRVKYIFLLVVLGLLQSSLARVIQPEDASLHAETPITAEHALVSAGHTAVDSIL